MATDREIRKLLHPIAATLIEAGRPTEDVVALAVLTVQRLRELRTKLENAATDEAKRYAALEAIVVHLTKRAEKVEAALEAIETRALQAEAAIIEAAAAFEREDARHAKHGEIFDTTEIASALRRGRALVK